MRIVIGQMKHETNTFSPVPTQLERFGAGRPQPLDGEAAIQAKRGTGAACAAFIELAEQAGATIDFAVAGDAPPSGPVHQEAFEYMAGRICEAVARGCDAVLLDLHGAMVTERFDDGEGELLRRLRAIAPQVPIGVALDMHANLYPALIEQATVVAGYQTYPHVDVYETGLRVGHAVLALQAGRVRPAMAWGNRPMLPHVMRQSSDDSPNREIQERCRQMQAQGALAASVFVGFPHADIENAGLSAVVVTDNDPMLAKRWCDELLQMAWQARHAFVYTAEPLEQSMARAQVLARAPAPAGVPPDAPVVLLDHYDNCASGGSMDTTAVLGAMIDAGLSEAAAFAIYDPVAVEQLIALGVGREATLTIGGRFDLPSIGHHGQPLQVTGRVKTVSDGHYVNAGPMGRGEQMNMGPSVVLQVGGIDVCLISRHVEPYDINCLRTLGIEPLEKRFLMLKSRIHWRAGLRPYARAIVECAGVGVCTSDYSTLNFRRVRRPIFPLDPI
jgi:microcystin degradation protein MlrC